MNISRIIYTMAMVIFKNGKTRELTNEQGTKLWEGLQHPEGLDEHQLDYLQSIKHLYLNWHHAPDSYIEANLDSIIPIVLNDWRVNERGKPLYPYSDEAKAFASKWNLYYMGQPTAKVNDYLRKRGMV
jgi:hypothetical protein